MPILGAMGKPVKVVVKGRAVFLCCTGCKKKFFANPDKYVKKLDEQSPQCVARNPGKAVILSGAKNLCDSSQILRYAQNDANSIKSCRTLPTSCSRCYGPVMLLVALVPKPINLGRPIGPA